MFRPFLCSCRWPGSDRCDREKLAAVCQENGAFTKGIVPLWQRLQCINLVRNGVRAERGGRRLPGTDRLANRFWEWVQVQQCRLEDFTNEIETRERKGTHGIHKFIIFKREGFKW